MNKGNIKLAQVLVIIAVITASIACGSFVPQIDWDTVHLFCYP